MTDELLADFVAETRETLEAISGEIVAWEADPANVARLDAIFRFVHTVKGNCGFFDFPRLEKLSHAAEGALSEVRAGRRQADANLVTAILRVIDRIAHMIDAIEAGEDLCEGEDDVLIAALEPDAVLPETVLAQGPSASRSSSTASQRSIRLPVELLDRVMSGISDLVLARNDLARRLRDAGSEPEIVGPFERLSTILEDVRDGITRIRMQRIESLFGTLPRLVRDLSSELGKQVMIDVEGGNVELDREVIEMIRDPLTHIIRNSIDHGIEPASERLAAGKREIGLLHISARQAGNKIVLTISDDGRGVDDTRLVEKALAAGIISQTQLKDMDIHARQDLMFAPGISTAEAVTSISGRGVGMDVVRANIERIGGLVDVQSTPGEGTRIYMRLPLTLSIIPALTVGVGNQKFAVPRAYIEDIVDAGVEDRDFALVGDQQFVTIRGERVRCVTLGDVFEIGSEKHFSDSLLIVIKLVTGDTVAFAVDQIHDHEDLVIKPISPPVVSAGLYSGSTLLDDGSPVLMLDIAGIAMKAGLIGDIQARPASAIESDRVAEQTADSTPVLQFIGLDGRRRVIRMEAIDRIESVPQSAVDLNPKGHQVVLGGRIYPLAGVDDAKLPQDRVNLVRLSDGNLELAYAIGEIVDTCGIDGEIVSSEHFGEFESVTLVGGETAQVVDCHWLFATYGRAAEITDMPVCRLPVGDAWTDTILRPLVEAAGYRVVGERDNDSADIAIAVAREHRASLDAARLIQLRDDAEGDGEGDADTIYRYDRASLIAALTEARAGRAA